jgi:hypothetical protein
MRPGQHSDRLGDRTVATSDKNHIDALVERSPRLTRTGILDLRLEPEDVVGAASDA